MRYFILFVCAFLLTGLICICTAEEASVSPQIAAKVGSIMKKNEDAIQIANDAALKDLKKMLASYKKDKNACILIAIKVHRIDKEDKDANEILKDVSVETADLLGGKGDAGKYISEVKAKLIADAFTKGKFTEKDWDNLPGQVIEIDDSRDRPKLIGAFAKGAILITPNPNDRWNKCSYKGDGAFNQLQGYFERASAKNDKDILVTDLLYVTPEQGTLSLYCYASGGAKPKGSIRVKIYEVIPFE